jgi:hypothetical protein
MVRRYRMQNKQSGWVAEIDFSPDGLKWLKDLRKIDLRFKFCRIFDMLQALPSKAMDRIFKAEEYIG